MSRRNSHHAITSNATAMRAADIPLDAIERNAEFERALALVRDGVNVFITGRAGTGKSTLLGVLRQEIAKKMVVLAPTGVAALNVRGETIHSFCKVPAGVTLKHAKEAGARRRGEDLLMQLELVVIDEVSMVRADLLDCLDAFLRAARGKQQGKQPFGGVQIVMIGDCYQLSPVVKSEEQAFFGRGAMGSRRGGVYPRPSGREGILLRSSELRKDTVKPAPTQKDDTGYASPWFFSAHVMRELLVEMVELQKVYRQRDEAFIALLNAIRNNTVDETHLAHLATRVADTPFRRGGENGAITLTTTNAAADTINAAALAVLSEKSRAYHGWIEGDFGSGRLPTEEMLTLKKGARVMFLTNDTQRKRWVNGTIGTIMECADEYVVVRIDGRKETVEVEPHQWSILRSHYNKQARMIDYETVASFTQLPLRLAWAVTIHKSQGLTFDRVVLDLGRGAFAHGQTYVALSRCRSFEGITLTRPVKVSDVRMDWAVVKFLTSFQYAKSDAAMPLDTKIARIADAISRGARLRITYLKRSDVRSERIITPREVGDMEYEGKPFLGIAAYCHERKDERVFRVDRILTMEDV